MRNGVTPTERKIAKRSDSDKARLEKIGILSVQRIGLTMQRGVYRAMKNGQPVWPAITKAIRHDFEPIVAAAMLASHVGGVRRAKLALPDQMPYSFSNEVIEGYQDTPFKEAVDTMQKRAKLTADQLDALEDMYGAQASKVCSTFEAHVNRRITRTIQHLVAEGAHISESKKALAEVFDALGITPENSFTLEGIFRTQVSIAYSAGAYQMEQDEAIQEILWGYKYVTVGDDRVRSEHAGFDGVTLPKDAPFWATNRPPNGWACRCGVIPLFNEPNRKHKVKQPKPVVVAGELVEPKADPGFQVNFGAVMAGK